jgi:3-methyladenine DNA glycosylase AlkC
MLYLQMKQLIAELKKHTHGFTHILKAGDECLRDKSINHLQAAGELLADESYQARMLATYILGQLSKQDEKAMNILETTVAKDDNWRVQEMLAKAFDEYCRSAGYEKSLPKIRHWLDSGDAYLMRAVIEGLRIWTGRPYFKDNPIVAIGLIAVHRSADSEYLRKSVGNALRDISKKHPDLVKKEIASWNLKDPRIAFTYALVVKNLALKMHR